MRHRARRPNKRRSVLFTSVAAIASLALVSGAVAATNHFGDKRHPRHHKNDAAERRTQLQRTASPRPKPSVKPSRPRVSSSGTAKSTARPIPSTAGTPAAAAPTVTKKPQPKCGTGSYQAEAVKKGATWTSRNGTTVVYTGDDMAAAVNAAMWSLTPDRTQKERVVVRGSGTMPASWRLRPPSYTILDVCGTITTTGEGASDTGPIFMRGVRDIEIQHLNVAGTAWYGIFARSVENITLRNIRIDGTGIGIRIDNFGNRAEPTRNIRIGDVYVTNSASHGVETFGVDNLTIGKVTARKTGHSGLLLNATTNAKIGTVDAVDAGTGTGYAAFRMANANGRLGESYPPNIHVGKVIARGGGRGVFCVSQSGGAIIDEVDIAGTGGHAVLVENCYNVTVGAKGGTVAGPGELRIAARAEFPNSKDVTFGKMVLKNTRVVEIPCGINTNTEGLKVVNTSVNTC